MEVFNLTTFIPKERAVFTFGQEKRASRLTDSVYSDLLNSCVNPMNQPTTIPELPKGFWKRVKWLRGLYKTFGETDVQLNALKNYQPQNAIQLKNLLQAYFNLSKKQLCNLNAYQDLKDVNILWRTALGVLNYIYIRSVFKLNSVPKMECDAFERFCESTYAVVGNFTLKQKRDDGFLGYVKENYEVRAKVFARNIRKTTASDNLLNSLRQIEETYRDRIDPKRMAFEFNNGDAYFGIFKSNSPANTDIRTEPTFQVRIQGYDVTKNNTYDYDPLDCEQSSPRREVRDDKRILNVFVLGEYGMNGTFPLKEKLLQIMIEIMFQNKCEKIEISSMGMDDNILATSGFEERPDTGSFENILYNIFQTRLEKGNSRFYPQVAAVVGGGVATIEFHSKNLSLPMVHFNATSRSDATTWERIIVESPILHDTGGYIPKYWCKSVYFKKGANTFSFRESPFY